ncbi:H-NS family nucleoid-associated regulatory protein [Aeromonas veronii]|uniref:H-NS family histone-like protein n=1 Tax=Aeromonas hydrophila TaxID=644 RepID=UPI001C5BB271|nr:H-NS family nucleoid-associated regulatory protein [Aeromonas hydrophila]MBW3834701.1 H-NS histone family protein [Aeromonas hydrophila]MBW5280365.1 H-NS histone family protein [Aeromonas hydrophila]
MNEFLKVLLNVRSLRAALRELSFEQLKEAHEKFHTIFEEREEIELREMQAREDHQKKLEEYAELLRQAGIDPNELISEAVPAGLPSHQKQKRAPRPPKYRYFDDGNEKFWTGQGRMPKAIADAVAGGKALEDFLI